MGLITNYAFTGEARTLSPAEMTIVNSAILSAPIADGYISGGARGVDVYAARCACTHFPEADHLIVCPNAPYHKEEVLQLYKEFPQVRILRLNTIGSRSARYMARNQYMVDKCDLLLAFPSDSSEKERSGTWATIRRAQKAGKKILLFPLNGEPKRVWDGENWIWEKQLQEK